MTVLEGRLVRLRPATLGDIPSLVRIRETPEVVARWRGGDDMAASVQDDLEEPDSTGYVIEVDGAVVGWIQWAAEDDPDYRHAAVDIFLHPDWQGRGLGADAIRTLAHHLFQDRGHHRLTIDPAAANQRAIRSYQRVGFRPVGVMRRYERGGDGTWHDGLLMDLLPEDLT